MSPPDEKKPNPAMRAMAEAQLAHHPVTEPLPAELLLQELQVHQIELEMQNEALRQKQAELEASRNRYVDLYDFSPVGYLTLTADGMVGEANLTAVNLLGMGRKDLLHRRFTSLVAADDQSRWMQLQLNVLGKGDKGEVEVAIRRHDGKMFQALLDCKRANLGDCEIAIRIAVTDITERKQTEATLSRYQCHLEELVTERTLELQSMARQLLTTEARERRILAAELHDDLGQHLALTKLKLGTLTRPDADQASVDYLQAMKAIEALIDQANDSVHSYSTQLSPLALTQFGLVAALESLTEDFRRVWGLSVKLHLCKPVPLDETSEATLFRIVRELLLNVLKHARVSEADLIMALDTDSGMLEITVADNGIGFDVEQRFAAGSGSGYGLGSIRQRIELMGGTMSIESQVGHGTIVSLTLMPEPVRQQ